MVEVLAGVSWRNGAPVPHTSHPGRVAPDGMVAVFATQRTIHSGAYPFEIGLRAPHMRVVSQVCPHLAAAIEADAAEAMMRALAEGYVAEMLLKTAGRGEDAGALDRSEERRGGRE